MREGERGPLNIFERSILSRAKQMQLPLGSCSLFLRGSMLSIFGELAREQTSAQERAICQHASPIFLANQIQFFASICQSHFFFTNH
jgi:hypothetical protein